MPKTKKKPFDPDEFLFDLYAMSRGEVEEMLFKEFDKIEPNFEKIKVIIDSGLVDVGAKNSYGSTPLHLACENNALECAKLLIARGADVGAKDNVGWTPLHWASRNNSIETAKLLLARGADVEAKTNAGSTPLHRACENNALELAKLLLEKGAEVGAKNKWGETPLDVAGSDEMGALLKQYMK